MKPLHTSSQTTASDSRMVVRVMEISTPDGPVRRIVVEANAEMDTTEARWLRDKLDLAITLAEGSPAVECVCGTVPGSYDGPLPECDVHGLPSAAYKAGYAMAQAEAEQMKALDRPAVSEDQPKPRVWHKGDVIPADVTKVYGDDWIYERSGEDAWQSGLAIECGYTGHPMLARSTESLLAQYGALSEVLADSEQATR